MTAPQYSDHPNSQPPGAELTILPRRAGRKEALPLLVHMIVPLIVIRRLASSTFASALRALARSPARRLP